MTTIYRQKRPCFVFSKLSLRPKHSIGLGDSLPKNLQIKPGGYGNHD